MYVSLSVTTYVTRWKDVSRWSRREGSSNLEKRRSAETRSDRMWRSWLSQQYPSWSRDTKHSSSLTLFSVFSVFYLKKELLKVKRLWVWLCFAQIQLLEMAFRGGLFIVILWVHFRVCWVVFNTSICTSTWVILPALVKNTWKDWKCTGWWRHTAIVQGF